MKNKLFRLFSILTALVFLLTSCDFSTGSQTREIRSLKIEAQTTSAKAGDSLTLTVKDDRNKTVDPSLLLSKSSDYSVATVGTNGEIHCIDGGLAAITVTLKNDMTVEATIPIFVEYHTQSQVAPTFTKAGVYVDAEFGKMGDLLLNFDFQIIDAVTSSSFLPLDMLFDFFSSEKYLFSMMYYRGKYEDAIICPLTSWTNANSKINTHLLTPEYVHEKMFKELGVSGADIGGSFEFYQDHILAFLKGTRADNMTYYFDHMNSDLQYRVVIKGDFDYVTNVSFYSNGVLTGLDLTVQDLMEKNFESLTTNYTYQKYYDEIANLSNLRICIEYRERAK